MTSGNLMALLHWMFSAKIDVETENNIMDISHILEHFNYLEHFNTDTCFKRIYNQHNTTSDRFDAPTQ